MRWILASASPRRRELLKKLVEEFEVQPSLAEEDICEEDPALLVQQLAIEKAGEVAFRLGNEGAFVIGADTVVALDGEVLGKPADEEEAFRMLSALSGREHRVYTGVCIARRGKSGLRKEISYARTKVRFHELSKEWILEYIASGSPMDKAGAYGIQDGGLVEGIEGSYDNVVGFPTELVAEMMQKVAAWEEKE